MAIWEQSETEPTTLTQAFEGIAALYPNRDALIDSEEVLSYTDLCARVARIASCLHSKGIGRGDLVAVQCEPSADVVAWILAIQRVGAGFLPIHGQADPPDARKILEDARPDLFVTDRQHHPDLETACALFPPNGYRKLPPEFRHVNSPLPRATDTAYVIYTSGTSGEPKGVPITHGNYLALHRATSGLFDFGPEDRWFLYHDLAFDFSVWEIFGALLSGGALVIPDRFTVINPERCAAMINRTSVSVLNQTPTAFSANRSALDRTGADSSLRYIIFGGERLTTAIWVPWAKVHGFAHPKLVNMYGITETTVHVSFYMLGPDDMDSSESRIGTVLPGFDAVVLDEDGQLATEGELYLAGLQVASGYRKRDDLTRASFRILSARANGATYYRTFDRVAIKPDGSLVYLDRRDRQFKYRGHRIELGEIERAYEEVPGVAQAVAVPFSRHRESDGNSIELGEIEHAYEDEPGVAQAVAVPFSRHRDHRFYDEVALFYTVADGEIPLAALRNAVKLERYKRPQLIVPVNEFPRTPNGKVDISALRDLLEEYR